MYDDVSTNDLTKKEKVEVWSIPIKSNNNSPECERIITVPLKYAERFFLLREAVLENYLLKDIEPLKVKILAPPKNEAEDELRWDDYAEDEKNNNTKLTIRSEGIDDEEDECELVYRIQLPPGVTNSKTMQLLVNILERPLPLTTPQLNELDTRFVTRIYYFYYFWIYYFLFVIVVVQLGMSGEFNEYLLNTMDARDTIIASKEEIRQPGLKVREYQQFGQHELKWEITPSKQWRVGTINLKRLQIFGVISVDINMDIECEYNKVNPSPLLALQSLDSLSDVDKSQGADQGHISHSNEICEFFFSDSLWNTWPIRNATIRVICCCCEEEG
ncbi:hypothetical protein RFI_19610 [Reticulomyxa filosa]|uniref:Uncharacterized protein n=1 Tax=Reticulomyxa filosa TaxID=46433 RepID=X6MV32_RETFI|nr:hypothetical protein RFI_19610 [Reticulomyxa filosa]|eukprot:ETO17704.1 hypothetical protein RFI_19610 [Reticulomyxa filosa]